MRILGVDPGTYKMGVGVVEEEREEINLLYSDVLTAARSKPLSVRLHYFYTQILELIERWQPNAVAIEQPFVAKNPRSALAIGQAQAVALVAAAHFSIPVSTYSPRQVKQSVADYGGSSKEQVREMVRVHLHLPHLLAPLDATDALAVALCHSHHVQAQQLISMTDERGVFP